MKRNKNNIWFDVFNTIIGYFLQDKYVLVDTGLTAIKIVDTVDDININIPGNYLVRDVIGVYDESKTLIQQLIAKDKLLVEDIEYFVAESDIKIHELNRIWNNSRIGDYGIDVVVGEPSDDHTFIMPSIVFIMDKEEDINMLESTGVDGLKTFQFNIGIVAKEKDLYDRTQAYQETQRIEDLVSSLIYDYFQSAYCKLNDANSTRLVEWILDSEIVTEDERPLILSKMINKVYYR